MNIYSSSLVETSSFNFCFSELDFHSDFSLFQLGKEDLFLCQMNLYFCSFSCPSRFGECLCFLFKGSITTACSNSNDPPNSLTTWLRLRKNISSSLGGPGPPSSVTVGSPSTSTSQGQVSIVATLERLVTCSGVFGLSKVLCCLGFKVLSS